MKKISTLLPILLLLTCSCNESINDPYSINFSDFFPNSNGNYYNYNVLVYDSSGIFVQSGTKKSIYNGDTIIFATPYQIKADIFQLTGLQTEHDAYFRKNSTGVFNCVEIDSNGFYYLIPDSLRGGISFTLEYPILYDSLELNQTWEVFKVRVDLLYIGFDAFTVNAEVVSLDTLTIYLQDTTRATEAYKIKYSASLTTSLTEPPQIFEVNAWIAKGIGFIKWQGNSELINFFAGAEIYPINTTVLEELESFKVN